MTRKEYINVIHNLTYRYTVEGRMPEGYDKQLLDKFWEMVETKLTEEDFQQIQKEVSE